ncbi:hypothetical protein ACFCXA_35335 [Streptomyces virginiae]|uniref:hypothetical protein n=1 Tax=Streptomyces virginiae TaxID=1961 RepID=UPI0035D90CD1
MAELLVDVVERIFVPVPVTALPGPARKKASRPRRCSPWRPSGGSWWTSLRMWAQTGPDTAEDIARIVAEFVLQFLTDDHEDVAEVLRQLEAVGVGQALAAHPTPSGAHPVHLSIVQSASGRRWCAPHPSGGRTTAPHRRVASARSRV